VAAGIILVPAPGESGLAVVRALGLVDAGGAAGTSGRALTAPVGQPETDEKHDQKYYGYDEVLHEITVERPVVAISPS